MALINCPECNNEISDIAKMCPKCGFKIKKKVNKLIIVITFAILTVCILSVIFIINSKINKIDKIKPGMTKEEVEKILKLNNSINETEDNSYYKYSLLGHKGILVCCYENNKIKEIFYGYKKYNDMSAAALQKNPVSKDELKWIYKYIDNNYSRTKDTISLYGDEKHPLAKEEDEFKSDNCNKIVTYISYYQSEYDFTISYRYNK